jgi:hypothetical protein
VGVGVVGLGIVLSVGAPLFGLGSLHASDMLNQFAPWRADAPYGFHPDNGQVSDTVNGVTPLRAELVHWLHDGDFALWTDLPGGGGPLGGWCFSWNLTERTNDQPSDQQVLLQVTTVSRVSTRLAPAT